MKTNITQKIILIVTLVALVFSLCACQSTDVPCETAEIYALDTIITLTAYGEDAAASVNAGREEIKRLEKLLSVTDSQSDISKINSSQGKWIPVSAETYELLKKSIQASELTSGKFDVTIYTVMKLWGFTEKEHRVPDSAEINSALLSVDYRNIEFGENNTVCLHSCAELDLGGIAKGCIGDKVAEKMRLAGGDYGVISLGGNVRTFGEKPNSESFKVGIQHPDGGMYFATLAISEASVITSGAYQRNFTQDGKTYHHIIDPSTGYPAESSLTSVTIIGDDGALCDALSTAIFVGGRELAEKLYSETGSFEYVILTNKGEAFASEGLKGKLTLTDEHKDIVLTFI